MSAFIKDICVDIEIIFYQEYRALPTRVLKHQPSLHTADDNDLLLQTNF